MNKYATWFGRIVWLGILANFAMALPALFLPDEMLAMMSLPSASPTMWPSFAALLLILLTLFYIPAAARPLHYRPVAWLAVLARLAGVIFFCIFHPDYFLFGLFDLTFFVPESILLTLAIRQAEKTIQGGAAGRNMAEATPGTNMPPLGAGKWKMRLLAVAIVLVAIERRPDVLRVLPHAAAALFRFRRRALSLRLHRHRSNRGRAVLDLAGAAAHFSGQVALCWRL